MVTLGLFKVISDLEDKTRALAVHPSDSFSKDLINTLANQYPRVHVLSWRMKSVTYSLTVGYINGLF